MKENFKVHLILIVTCAQRITAESINFGEMFFKEAVNYSITHYQIPRQRTAQGKDSILLIRFN